MKWPAILLRALFMQKTESEILFYRNKLEVPTDIKNYLLIYDKKLLRFSEAKKIISKFKFSIGVTAGEGLKQWSSLEKVLLKANHMLVRSERKTISGFVAMGGGSITDAVGFLASIYKRGKPLVVIPSTWLAALDSAHGGKNAINFLGIKNQLGTFYFAKKILIYRELLFTQDPQLATQSYSELFKVALLQGGSLWQKVSKNKAIHAEQLWDFLPEAIQAKMKIVNSDPLEQKGERQKLNLGHTWGHVFEAQLKKSHGQAIAVGLHLSLLLSRDLGHLSEETFKEIVYSPGFFQILRQNDLAKDYAKLSKVEAYLSQDKKNRDNKKIRYVFIRKPGDSLVEDISLKTLVQKTRKVIRMDKFV